MAVTVNLNSQADSITIISHVPAHLAEQVTIGLPEFRAIARWLRATEKKAAKEFVFPPSLRKG